MEIEYNGFIISDDKGKLQIHRIKEMLATSYWAKSWQEIIIRKTIENSLCFGVYQKEKQIGFARCVTDHSTIYWVGDVIVDYSYRDKG